MVKKGTILKWVTLSLLVAYCVVVCAWARTEAGRHRCVGIEISVVGNARMDSVVRRGVTEQLRHYPKKIVGELINTVNTADIERYLSGLSNFESVSCMITSGGEVKIEIVPLIPVMRVFFGDNSYYINKDGKHIESKAEFFTHVPMVSGKFTRDFQPKSLLPLVRFVESDPMLRELVSMVEAKDANNIILVPRVQGHVVNFGDTTRLNEKKEALRLFYNKVMPYKGWEEYDTISVKFKGQVVASRRVKPVTGVAAADVEDIDPDEITIVENLGVGNSEPPVAPKKKEEQDSI